jgi:hypothetical protein
MNEEAIKHLKEHVNYPATKAEIMAGCNSLTGHVPPEEIAWVEKLPEGTYQSVEEALSALDNM